MEEEDENKLQAKTLEDFAKNPKFMEIMRKLAENQGLIEKAANNHDTTATMQQGLNKRIYSSFKWQMKRKEKVGLIETR